MKKLIKWAILPLFLLLTSCQAGGGEFDAQRFLLSTARILGDAVIQAKGFAALEEAGGGMLARAMDKQEPLGVLTLAEVEEFVTGATPEEIAALLAAWLVIQGGR